MEFLLSEQEFSMNSLIWFCEFNNETGPQLYFIEQKKETVRDFNYRNSLLFYSATLQLLLAFWLLLIKDQ